MTFSFKNNTKEEEQKISAKKKEISQKTQSAAETLQHCLESDSLAKYRKEFEEASKSFIELGIDIMKTIKDSKERVFLYDALFVRADVLGLLLKRINHERSK